MENGIFILVYVKHGPLVLEKKTKPAGISLLAGII